MKVFDFSFCSWAFLLGCFLWMTQGVFAQKIQVDFEKKSEEELTEIRSANSIDLSGVWEGVITQYHWDGKPQFENPNDIMRIRLEHNGNKVTGRVICNARFKDNMGKLYYEKEFSGIFDGQILQYKDEKVHDYMNTHKCMRRLETCMKMADLEFFIKDGDYYLEGDWSGYGHIGGNKCTPGRIEWRKINPEKEEKKVAFEVNFLPKRPSDLVIRKDIVKKIKGRKVTKGQVVKVKSQYITLEIYDHKRDDGDIVSLNYNGRWILENYRLDKEKHTVDVFIENVADAPNYLILYAHNLGGVPPNTAAIVIDDGERKQQFVLNSDLKESDVIYFELVE